MSPVILITGASGFVGQYLLASAATALATGATGGDLPCG